MDNVLKTWLEETHKAAKHFREKSAILFPETYREQKIVQQEKCPSEHASE